MNTRPKLSFWPSVLSLALTLAGCETHPFSGSAAMRIDVDVYKGPLSEEPETQWGNLGGLVDQTERWLIASKDSAQAVLKHKGFVIRDGQTVPH